MDTDLQLLDRYARSHDADAFTQLVRRHAGMVFAAARRITSDHHDAEEVAQSCFLDLSRQAGSIHGSVAGWLHTVATNRAVMCNRAEGRRRRRERIAARTEMMTQAPWEDIAPWVDAALAEMDEELRLPVVLYHLEGRSQAEVAAELGVNQSTVSRRLEAGVAALREKLQAAGVEAPSVALPALLARHAIVAAPKTLVAAMGKLAVSGLVPSAGGVASGAVSGGVPGGGVVVSGTTSLAGKGAAVLGMKIVAAVVITAAVSTAGVALLPKQQPVIAASVATDSPVMSEEASAILARLKTQVARGMGDGVGIFTASDIGHDQSKSAASFLHGLLVVYAQQGASKLFLHYSSDKNKGWRNQKAAFPSAWPTPDPDETLRFIDPLRTTLLEVTDGHTWWHTQQKGHQIKLISSQIDGSSESFATSHNAWGWIWWPLTDVKSDQAPNQFLSMELIHRPDHSGLDGLHFTWGTVVAGNVPRHLVSEETHWLDPARNDVEVEDDVDVYNGHPEIQHSDKTVFLDYAQLPDGRWYPTHWQRHWDRGWPDIDEWFTFTPGKSLDPKWFGDPSARFTPDTGAAGSSAAKGVAAVPQVVAAAVTSAANSAWWWWPWALAVAVFGAAAVLLIRQRRNQIPDAPLRGAQGPRRK